MLHESVSKLNENLAGDIKDSYSEQIEMFNADLVDVLRDGFAMSRDEVFDFLQKSEKTAYDYALSELKVVFRQNANQNLIRKFNEYFKKDENGKRRDWRSIEEEKIKEVWDSSKLKVEALMEQFKLIFFPQNVTKIDELGDFD